MERLSTDDLRNYLNNIMSLLVINNIFAWQISDVMRKGGMRFDEVGGNTWTADTDNIRLLPRKGNDARIFIEGELPSFFYEPIKNGGEYDPIISYNLYVNLFKAYRPYPIYLGKKELIAHSFRHLYARERLQYGEEPNQIRQKMGEKTMATMATYLYAEVYRM